ncbi:hypothetical protein LINPERHAP2_LOCUS19724, partial [Linum perenne]
EFLAKHQHDLNVGVIVVCLCAFILKGGTSLKKTSCVILSLQFETKEHERPSWKEIVRPVVTRFATHFELLKSTFAHKAHLWTLFGSTFFEADATSSTTKGIQVQTLYKHC